MIINNAVNAGGFIYCNTYYSPKESNEYFNSGDGHYHQALYILDGQATATVSNTPGGEPIPSLTRSNDPVHTLIDLSETKDKYVNTVTDDVGLGIIMFNPLPANKVLRFEIVNGPVTRAVECGAGDKRVTIVGLVGSSTANTKQINSLQFARVTPGKVVDLTVADGGVVALVKE